VIDICQKWGRITILSYWANEDTAFHCRPLKFYGNWRKLLYLHTRLLFRSHSSPGKPCVSLLWNCFHYGGLVQLITRHRPQILEIFLIFESSRLPRVVLFSFHSGYSRFLNKKIKFHLFSKRMPLLIIQPFICCKKIKNSLKLYTIEINTTVAILVPSSDVACALCRRMSLLYHVVA
jgi:hypothetical protein